MRSIDQTSDASASPARIHPATRLGPVHLTVADLDRELDFYREVLGFSPASREGRVATLSAGGGEAPA